MSWITLHYTALHCTALHPCLGSARAELCFRTAQCGRHFLQPPLVVCSRRRRQRRCQAQQVSLLQIGNGNGNGIWMGICMWPGDVQAGEAGAQVLLVAVQVFAMPPSG